MISLDEWMKCQTCRTPLTYQNICTRKDCDNEKIGRYCKECGEIKYQELVKSRAVICETRITYVKDGKYFPYWGALYYYEDLDDVISCINRVAEAIIYPVWKHAKGE